MDPIDEVLKTAAAANACFIAGMKAADENMGARLIAAGARAAESERKLRRLIAACDELKIMLLSDQQFKMGLSREARERAFDMLGDALKEAQKP